MLAGERVSGGPVKTSFFSNVSGAGRAPVRMRGMFAAASSVATCVSLALDEICRSEVYLLPGSQQHHI
jgi:hypothetical protein